MKTPLLIMTIIVAVVIIALAIMLPNVSCEEDCHKRTKDRLSYNPHECT